MLIEFRAGSRGAPMLIEGVPFTTLDGVPAHDSVVPLASECWEAALLHRADTGGERLHYRIKVVTTDEESSHSIIAESDWIEIGEDEAGDLNVGDEAGGGTGTERMLSSMVGRLFSANIQLTRAAGALVREAAAGRIDQLRGDMEMIDRVKALAMASIDREKEIARAEADSQEVAEFGKTARQWLAQAHESKLSKEGMSTPPIPKNRRDAARALYSSLTVGQLEALRADLGEHADLLVSLLSRSGDMTEQSIADALGSLSTEAMLKISAAAEKAFSSAHVPGPWAAWQMATARVVMEGGAD